jgi:hypothetical protein
MMWSVGIDFVGRGEVFRLTVADSEFLFKRGFAGARYDCEGCDKA